MTASRPQPVAYVRFRGKFGVATVLADIAPMVRDILAHTTLYDYAARQSGARVFTGRGPVYAIPLGPHQVVVRHARHGGWLARWTGDVFLGRTRSQYELAVSLQLRASGVNTPEVMGYIRYDAGPFLRRADVITREVSPATPLEKALADRKTDAWAAATDLAQALGRAGAFHRDLNVRNVLLVPRANADSPNTPGAFDAYALDVDRVVWGVPGDPALAQANIRRLQRSARKLGLL